MKTGAAMKKEGTLTPKQAEFVRQYLVDLNATQAAIRAGYSKKTANVTGYELTHNPDVVAAIEKAKAERAERVEVSAAEVLRELRRIGLADIGQAFGEDGNLLPLHKMPEDVRRAISSVEVEELFEGRGSDRVQIGVLRKVKFWDKPRGIEMLCRHVSISAEFNPTQKHEHTGKDGERLSITIDLGER